MHQLHLFRPGISRQIVPGIYVNFDASNYNDYCTVLERDFICINFGPEIVTPTKA